MTTEENKAVARRFFEEVVSGGNLGVVDAICAPSYRLHATLSGPDAIDRDQLKDLVRSWRSSFGDGRISIENLVAEGDLVAARMTETGTHTGEFNAIPPTGKEVRYGSMTFLRIQRGKIVEHWGLLDMPTCSNRSVGGDVEKAGWCCSSECRFVPPLPWTTDEHLE